jgi:hypothetical protein
MVGETFALLARQRPGRRARLPPGELLVVALLELSCTSFHLLLAWWSTVDSTKDGWAITCNLLHRSETPVLHGIKPRSAVNTQVDAAKRCRKRVSPGLHK